MHKLLGITWGRDAGLVWGYCEKSYTFYTPLVVNKNCLWLNKAVFTRRSTSLYRVFPSAKFKCLSLLNSFLSPVSTPPLTTTTFNNYLITIVI